MPNRTSSVSSTGGGQERGRDDEQHRDDIERQQGVAEADAARRFAFVDGEYRFSGQQRSWRHYIGLGVLLQSLIGDHCLKSGAIHVIEPDTGCAPWRHPAHVPPGHEPRSHADAKCPPPWRPPGLRLGRAILELARDRRPGLGAGGGLAAAASSRATASWCIQELRRDVLVDVRGLPARRGLGSHEFQADAGRGGVSRDRLRRQGVPVPRRFSRPCRRGRRRRARRSAFTWRIGEGAFAEEIGGRGDIGAMRAPDSKMPRSTMTIPAGSFSPRARQGGPRRRADPRPDGLRRDQSPGRPDARHDGGAMHRWWWRRCRTARACTS